MTETWIEVSVIASPDTVDAVSDILQTYGYQGVVIERAGFEIETWEDEIPPVDEMIVRVYLPADAQLIDKQQQIKDALQYAGLPGAEFRSMAEVNWAEAWKEHYKPLRIGQRLYMHPAWYEADTLPDRRPDDLLISLDPGMAFGTGTHPSTQLCMEAIEELSQDRPGLSVLDLGCGSGILSIAAAKLGASKILALDIEEIAVEITEENAILNDVAEQIQAQTGSLQSVTGSARRFDVALVNILAKVIMMMCDEGLERMLRPGGIGVFGGIIQEQADEVEAALRKTGLVPYKRRFSGEWVVIEARRPAV